MVVPSAVRNEVKAWFKKQHIVVPADWVEACIEWVKQEYQNENMPMQDLKNHVYEQWLAADFQEIGAPTLPVDLITLQKTTLSGFYALQVNGIRDVGRPAYNQLKQIEGTTNENAQVSATPQQPVPQWEAKPTRMFMLNLTDGITHIQGMEYKHIFCLSDDLPPGTKVLINGPVDCRFGILMLTPERVKILGGGVEALAEKYSKTQVLIDTLQLGEGDIIDNTESGYFGSEFSSRNTTSGSINPVSMISEADSYDRSYIHPISSVPTSCTPLSASNSKNCFTSSSTFNDHHSEGFNRTQNLDFDYFESEHDDDFVRSLDHKALDEIERKSNAQSVDFLDNYEENEDEDMVNEMMAFQAQAEVSINVLVANTAVSNFVPSQNADLTQAHTADQTFSHLSSILKNQNPSAEFSTVIKGFIEKVLSKLECTSMGWQLTAKISDDTASLEVNIHDKVLHEFIGISAKEMLVLQKQAGGDSETRNKIFEALTKCKKILQDLNGLMEIKFSPNYPLPFVIKYSSLHK